MSMLFFNMYLSIYFLTSMYFTAVDFVKYVVHLIFFVSDSFGVAVRLSLLKSIISYCFIFYVLNSSFVNIVNITGHAVM